MSNSVRWLVAGVIAAVCAVGGVFVASFAFPRAAPEASVTPVVVAVTTTSTAHPSAEPAPVATAPGINLSERSIDSPKSIWVVVNKQRPLDPIDFAPKLAAMDVPGGGQMATEAAKAAEQMYAAAKKAGAPFRVSSAYRSYNFQKGLFAQYVASDGLDAAEHYSARPGHSEHQSGLAVDFYDPVDGCRLKRCYAETPSGKWLVANAADFGFIERYGEGHSDVTGYKWEPWHWRYVGVELAQYMRDEEIANLEDVFGLPAAPDYD